MLSPSRILFWTSVCFLAGVAMATLFSVPVILELPCYLVGISCLAVNHKKKFFWLVFFCFFAFGVGVRKTNHELADIHPREERIFEGVGWIARQQKKEDYQVLVITPVGYRGTENIRVTLPIHPSFQAGEIVHLRCELADPKNQYGKFDYIRYLAKDHIYKLGKSAAVERVVDHESILEKITWKNRLKIKTQRALVSVATRLEKAMAKLYPQPEGGYLAGLLLGGDDRLPSEVQEYFKRTGTTHTVAVSGYNITIIAEFLMMIGIVLGLWRRQAFWFAAIGIIIFVLLIGWPSSAVRAAIMGIIALWATKNGRTANMSNSIVLTASIMVWASPLILFYDASFQLSFLATLGIVGLSGNLTNTFRETGGITNSIMSTLEVTLAAQAGVLGILLYNFESFSIISLLANIIILPLIPVIMLGGFISIVFSFISYTLALAISLPVWYLLHWQIWIVRQLSKPSWASVDTKGLGLVWLVVYYFFIIMLYFHFKRKNNQQ